MTSSVFSNTLSSITTAKLFELSKKRDIFEKCKSSSLSKAQLEPDQQKRLRILIKGVKQAFLIKTISGRKGRDPQIARGVSYPHLELFLRNLERYLDQAQYDPSVSPKILSDWEKSLIKHLEIQSDKYKFATLYGNLVTEWLNSEKKDGSPDDAASMMTDDFVKIESAERDQARSGWEKIVFEPLETDQLAINRYLQQLFGDGNSNKQALKALTTLQESVTAFEATMSAPGQFNQYVLTWTINGLMSSGLLSEEKLAVARDFLASPVILDEIADVLNLRIQDISTWSWEAGVPVEQRRRVNGAYHVYFDEELLQAIFLQYIGIKWAVFFKEAFSNFSNADGAWTSIRAQVSKLEKKRREYYLGAVSISKKPSVQSKRQGIHRSVFWLSQLPDSVIGQANSIEGEEEANYETHTAKRPRTDDVLQDFDFDSFLRQDQQNAAVPVTPVHPKSMVAAQNPQQQQQQQQMMAQQSAMAMQAPPNTAQNPDALQDYQMQLMLLEQQNKKRLMMARQEQDNIMAPRPGQGQPTIIRYFNEEFDLEPENSLPKTPIATKQFLLHLLSTEILINTRLHGDFTCARSTFESWYPSLPHSTISSVLSFFGLSKKWLSFFQTFLSAPLKFTTDDESVPTRNRKRGVPGAHSLSLVCGEAILFCLDYAVNQHANGTPLYRMHDDFWVWSKDHNAVVQAWSAITHFTEVMGVSLNQGKTGSVRIVRNQFVPMDIDARLPKGEIRWGFLVLSPVTGKFEIDQEMVNVHIKQLHAQLKGKDQSVLAWIQVWNTYLGTFFRTNFGKAANCFGRGHVDAMLETLKRIQKELFGDGNVVEYLRGIIKERFGIDDVPDGWFYFPTGLGGLDVVNPFVELMEIREGVLGDLESVMDEFLEKERETFEDSRRRFDKGERGGYRNVQGEYKPTDGKAFLEWDEFVNGREEFCTRNDGNLLGVFEELLEKPSEESVDLTEEQRRTFEYEGVSLNDGYTRWVVEMYGEEMEERFGSLRVVEKGLLPMGMVDRFRSGRVKWQG